MKLRIRDRLRLAWYNNVVRYLQARKLRRMWLAEGRPPRKFYGSGRISLECLDWGRREAERIMSLPQEAREARPFEEFRRDVQAGKRPAKPPQG